MCYFCGVKIHEKYLSRCLQIAKNGLGNTAPNPMVGAVVVHGDRVIGEGFTSPYGGPHAEVRAIASVKDQSLLKEATLYVSLEPCCHHGKTPPCTDLILEKGIPKVVLGIPDPHAKVGGKGIAKLREGGCEVLTGVLEAACREHLKRFLTFHEKRRPYVILKWAQSADGFFAPEKGLRDREARPYWISGPRARQLAHQWRSEEQAILVGTRTAIEDNPALTTREWKGRNPLRVLLDRTLRVPAGYRVFDGQADTLVCCAADQVREPNGRITFQALDFEGDPLPDLMRLLWEKQVLSLIVEGGGETLQGFIKAGLWDEARVIESPLSLGGGLPAPRPGGTLIGEFAAGQDRVKIFSHD
jgi:diaminohydroxyphosphoribosylaminopyrimidine deaminase/5-amino-6-(5-phosphoribosylamino)uracil reductase